MKKIILFALLALIFSSCSFSQLTAHRDNITREYYTGGMLRSEFILTDKKMQKGILKTYDFDGKLQSSSQMMYGKKDGLETLYDQQGRIMQNTPYVKGLRHGKRIAYYPDGTTMLYATYVNGIKDGVAATFNKDGSIYKKIIYKKGIPQG